MARLDIGSTGEGAGEEEEEVKRGKMKGRKDHYDCLFVCLVGWLAGFFCVGLIEGFRWRPLCCGSGSIGGEDREMRRKKRRGGLLNLPSFPSNIDGT